MIILLNELETFKNYSSLFFFLPCRRIDVREFSIKGYVEEIFVYIEKDLAGGRLCVRFWKKGT
jgi:hypothetical protein